MRNLARTFTFVAAAVAVTVFGDAGSGAAAVAEAPLVEAARSGNAERVQALLAQGLDANAPDGDGTTALHWAALNDDVASAEALLAAGARADAANRFDATPLAVASENGSAAFVELLLDAGADPNWATPEGETALMTAARTGRADAVRLLLDRGADPNRRESWRGQNALMWAAAENHLAAADALIDGGADVTAGSDGGFTPLLFAVRAGYLGMTRKLLAAGASPDETLPDGTQRPRAGDEERPLRAGRAAARRRRRPERRCPGLDGAPRDQVDAPAQPRLQQPAAHRHGLDVRSGLHPPCSPRTARTSTPRMTKEPNNRYRNVLNRIGSTPFLLAAKAADVEMMRLLVELGADPQLPNEDGTTPLMVAAGVGIWAVGESPGTNEEALAATEYALALGGDVTTIDDNGDTALHGAVIRGSEPLVRYLLARGADLEATNEKGWTPLRIAKGVFYSNTGKRWPEMETLLLELGADPSLATGADNTISDWSAEDAPPDVR